MEMLMAIWAWIMAHSVVLLAAALSLSEALALIPGVAANSIFQLVVGWIKKLKGSAA